MIKNILYICILLAVTSCSMNNKNHFDKKEFKELHEHKRSENYEIFEIVPRQNEADYFLLDSIEHKLIVDSFFEPKSKKQEEMIYQTFKLDLLGTKKDSYKAHSILSDGTMWDWNYYVTWMINGDTTKHLYIDPFSGQKIEKTYEFQDKEKNPDNWMKKFNEFYTKSQYVYIYMSMYYLKVEDKWYFMEANLEELSENLKKQYPPKEDQDIRMLEMVDLAPEYYHPEQGASGTDLIKMKGYESTFFETEDQGLGSYSFSAGWWYLEIHMPLGDTIRIKRYSNFEDPELQLYKVPSEYGGREDVLFIVQKPEEMFPEQVGGMFVIRPKDLKQPERRYKSLSYGTNDSGETYIKKSQDTEAYTQWIKNKS